MGAGRAAGLSGMAADMGRVETRAASAGTIPASAIASAAATSTRSHVSKRRSSLQIPAISG